MTDATFQKFFQLEKYDSFQGIATGIATAEQLDRDNEILDYLKSKPLFEAWSESVHKDSGGKSFGNVRRQHDDKIVAGRLNSIEFNDDAKLIRVEAKIVDPLSKELLETGCLTGFSIGGRYVSKTPQSDGTTRYVADPCEISVVDRPALPNAVFQSVKSDGSTELRKFAKYEEANQKTEVSSMGGIYKDSNESPVTTIGTRTRNQILRACSAGRNSLTDAQHPAHANFHSIAKAVGGQWSGDSNSAVRNDDITSPGTFDRPDPRDIAQTSVNNSRSNGRARGLDVIEANLNQPIRRSSSAAERGEFEQKRRNTVAALYKAAAAEKDADKKRTLEKLAAMLEAVDVTKSRTDISFSSANRRRSFAERHATW